MSHGPEHHIEQAEHAAHAAQDPFDRRVTMSIAIVAAILACITMLGHRAHNETLRLQMEAGIAHSKASNKWNYFQAQKLRGHMYQINLEMLAEVARLESKPANSSPAQERWQKQMAKYGGRLDAEEKKARALEQEVVDLQRESHHAHQRGDRFDYAELGVEFALVLCSIAVLTKRKGFWYVGILSCLLGSLVALSALFDLFMTAAHH